MVIKGPHCYSHPILHTYPVLHSTENPHGEHPHRTRNHFIVWARNNYYATGKSYSYHGLMTNTFKFM